MMEASLKKRNGSSSFTKANTGQVAHTPEMPRFTTLTHQQIDAFATAYNLQGDDGFGFAASTLRISAIEFT